MPKGQQPLARTVRERMPQMQGAVEAEELRELKAAIDAIVEAFNDLEIRVSEIENLLAEPSPPH
jgi:hypothetical protein